MFDSFLGEVFPAVVCVYATQKIKHHIHTSGLQKDDDFIKFIC